jgi:hypothetical protein
MSGGIIPYGNGLVYSTGYVLGVASLGAGLAWDADAEQLNLTTIPWASLPAEAQSQPIVISIPGKPAANVRSLISLPLGYTVPANFAGTTTIQDVAASENAVWSFSIVRGDATTALGTVTLLPAGGTANTLSEQAAYTIQDGDALLMVSPETQDATMSGIGITLVLKKI